MRSFWSILSDLSFLLHGAIAFLWLLCFLAQSLDFGHHVVFDHLYRIWLGLWSRLSFGKSHSNLQTIREGSSYVLLVWAWQRHILLVWEGQILVLGWSKLGRTESDVSQREFLILGSVLLWVELEITLDVF